MNQAITLPWAYRNPDGGQADWRGASLIRAQDHEIEKARAAGIPDIWRHVCVNSIRQFDGAWRERDATQAAPAPEAGWPILKRIAGPVPEVFYDIRSSAIRREIVQWIVEQDTKSANGVRQLLIDDVQLAPDYITIGERAEWSDAWRKIIYSLAGEGFVVGVNLWPLSAPSAPLILAATDLLMIEAFSPSHWKAIGELIGERQLIVQWSERVSRPDHLRRAAAIILSEHVVMSGRLNYAIDNGAGVQIATALAAPEAAP